MLGKQFAKSIILPVEPVHDSRMNYFFSSPYTGCLSGMLVIFKACSSLAMFKNWDNDRHFRDSEQFASIG